MKALLKSTQVEAVLFIRGFFGFFFTFFFPVIMLLLFGSIFGNEPSDFYGGYGAMDMAVPSYIAMIIGVNGLMSFPLSLAEYKEHNIYKRFDATPAGKGVIIGAQVIVNFIMTAVGILLLVAVGKAVYGVQIDGGIFVIIAAILLCILSIFSLGFFITAISRDMRIANLLCYLLYFIMLFASGATVPGELFPEGIRTFSAALPLTHVVKLMKGAFARMPFTEYSVSVLILAGMAAGLGALGALIYRKKTWN